MFSVWLTFAARIALPTAFDWKPKDMAKRIVEPIEVDIQTRIFASNEQMHVLFPGEGYSNFQEIERRSLVFLDFPGLDLADKPDDAWLKEKILRSLAIADWHQGGGFSAPPSRDLNDYRKGRSSERRRNYAAGIERLYFGLKPGALILVPSPGPFGYVLIGELAGSKGTAKLPRYGDDHVPVRRVRWIGRISKRQLSESLLARLVLPIPILQLERSLVAEVIKKGFSNYFFDGEYVAKFNTTEDIFNSVLDYDVQGFVNFVAGVSAMIELGEVPDHKVTLDDALAFLRRHPEFTPELTSNINSPGGLRYITQEVTAIVVAVVLVVGMTHPVSAATHVHVINSLAPADDPCAFIINNRVNQAFEIMDIPGLKKQCIHTRDAAKKTGLTPTVVVKSHAHTSGKAQSDVSDS